MTSKFLSLWRNNFIQNNLVLFLGGLLTGAVNYALYPLISRAITVEQFGEIQILMALITQLAIAGAVIRIFVVNVVKEKTDDAEIDGFLRNTSRTLLVIGFGMSAVFLLLSPWLARTLQFGSAWPLVPTVLSVVLGFQFMVPLSHLQAKQFFNSVSLLQLAQALSKVALAAALGYAGFGVAGILWGVVASGALMQYWAHRASKRSLTAVQSSSFKARFVWGSLKSELNYIVAISVTMAAVTFLLSLDTFFVKYYFSPEDAGLYAGIAVVARTLFFLTSSVAGVMISSVKQRNSRQANIRAYTGSVVLMTAISAVALVGILLATDIIITVLLGSEFLVYSDLLPKLSLAMYAVGMINLITNYHVAMRERWVLIPTLGGLSVTGLLVSRSVDSLAATANAFLLGVLLTLALCSVWTIMWNIRRSPHHDTTKRYTPPAQHNRSGS